MRTRLSDFFLTYVLLKKFQCPVAVYLGLNVVSVQLSYRVTLPLEKEDVLLITHELPTEKAKIVFDYTEVREEISVYGIPVTGTIEPLEPEKDNDSKIKYVISGWILPKQGYVFGWWKK